MDWLKRRQTVRGQDANNGSNPPLSPPLTPKKLSFTVSFPSHSILLPSSPTTQNPSTTLTATQQPHSPVQNLETSPSFPAISPFSTSQNGPVLNLSPYSSRITGTLHVHNNTLTSITLTRCAIILLSGQGLISMTVDDPESSGAVDLHKRPLARASAVLWDGDAPAEEIPPGT